MKKFICLDSYDGVNASMIDALNVDGYVVGDPFCEFRMFKTGYFGMIDFIRSLNAANKEVVFQTPTYITDRKFADAVNLISYLYTELGVRSFIVQDVGVADHIRQVYPDAVLIWGQWGRVRNSLMNRDFICFLISLGINGIQTGQFRRMEKITKMGMGVHAVYGEISYNTISRNCYSSYMLDRFSGICERECLNSYMSMSHGTFKMSVDGYILGNRKRYPGTENFINEIKDVSKDIMIYADDFDAGSKIISDVFGLPQGGNDNE